VKFVGFDSSEKLIAALEQGHLQGLVLQNPFWMGDLGVRTIVEHMKNPSAPPPVRQDTGVRVATPENMREAEIAALLRPPLEKYLQ
jgi:ribose transport system substrate-binding protein